MLSGVRSQRLIRGSIKVNARLANDEAHVAATNVDGGRIYVFGARACCALQSDYALIMCFSFLSFLSKSTRFT